MVAFAVVTLIADSPVPGCVSSLYFTLDTPETSQGQSQPTLVQFPLGTDARAQLTTPPPHEACLQARGLLILWVLPLGNHLLSGNPPGGLSVEADCKPTTGNACRADPRPVRCRDT